MEISDGMKYVDDFRNKKLADKLVRVIKSIIPGRRINIMEVCGTHTHNFFRFGLDKVLPDNIRFISGPGCPVCVSPWDYIDKAIAYAKEKENIVVTFGDMLRVRGSVSTLEEARVRFSNVKVAYSALDSLKIANDNPSKNIIFLAVGFETTIPTIAISIVLAKKQKINNLFFFSSLKLIPPVMEHLLRDERVKVDGFLCPGHVSVVTGEQAYKFIPRRYKIPCCIAGFEPLDILEGIYFIVEQIAKDSAVVQNQYTRVVSASGNAQARKLISQVFMPADADWRGLGRVPLSGLKARKQYCDFDAEEQLPLKEGYLNQRLGRVYDKCRCGDVLKGLINPSDCSLFAKVCTTINPIGPCMISNEGACNAYYRYKK